MRKRSDTSFIRDALTGCVGVFMVAFIILLCIPAMVYGMTFIEATGAL